jgi:hypothetical protein
MSVCPTFGLHSQNRCNKLSLVSVQKVHSSVSFKPHLKRKEFVVCSTNKTDRQDITEILLKVVLNTITLTPLFHDESAMVQI